MTTAWPRAAGARHFGLYFSRGLAPAESNHNLRTLVVDAQDKVRQIFSGNAWTVDELAESLFEGAKAK